ncbi:sulfur carrier protein ThiS [Aeromicrobium sp. CF4.19]|uniref:sulfur carrier protein ThiS n=1 Tax=Aeromicrobium sp. CF4.19 TaxID=3373082 RepID=UPI003EE50F99
MSEPMVLVVNGRDRECDPAVTIPSLVGEVSPATTGIAVAVNGTLVPRSQWRTTPLVDGDRVDVVTAVQGG